MFEAVIDLRDRRGPALPNGARLALLENAMPGPDVMADLASINVETLSDFDQVVLLRTWERQRAWLDAMQQPVLTAVGVDTDGFDWGREEITAALALSKVTAGRRLDVARALMTRLRATYEALSAGRLSYYHAAHLAEATEELSDEVTARVEELALRKALSRPGKPGQSLANFRRTVARTILTADPSRAGQDNENAVAGRSVQMYDSGAGTGSINADRLPADKAALVMSVLRARAGSFDAADGRNQDQRLADAFIAVFEDAHARLHLPTQQGRRPVTSLVLDFATFVGLADHPGYLDGYGYIPATMARRIADESDLRRLITDPVTGYLLDASPRTYRPSQGLTDFVIDRDRVCDGIGCNRPARTCDLDHTVPFSEGGTTTRGNLGPGCGRDHPLRHEGGWGLAREPDGTAIWTSRAGHRYVNTPWDYRPLE